MKVAVIGGGFTGLAAAFELTKLGHHPIVLEAGAQLGGLASGFRDSDWDWTLERFYHHIFVSDRSIIALATEIAASDLLLVSQPVSAFHCDTHGSHPFDSPVAVGRYPHLSIASRARLAVVIAWLRTRTDWRSLENVTADRWLRTHMGNVAYETVWRPLLVGKFGPYYQTINMGWFWARIATRTRKLGYFKGGFQTFADRLGDAIVARGGELRLATPARHVRRTPGSPGGAFEVQTSSEPLACDAVVVTTSPDLLVRLVPELPGDYTVTLKPLQSMGAAVVTLALDRPLLDKVYWLNFAHTRHPFLCLVEHTNMINRQHYGGRHILYIASYAPIDSDLFGLSLDEILARWLPALVEVAPHFERAHIQNAWLHREIYAQPVVGLGHSLRVPKLETPIPGLFWASMSHVYPWDRGTNFAVEIGRRVAHAAASGDRTY